MQEQNKHEFALQVEGKLLFVIFIISFPVLVFLRRSGSFGRWSTGFAIASWMAVSVLFLWIPSTFVGELLFGLWELGPLTGWFVLAASLLASVEGIEVLCRQYPSDDVLGKAPGEPRLYLWDWWLPESWNGREFVLRVGEPVAALVIGSIAGSKDAGLGTFIVFSGFCLAALNNFMFLCEKMNIKRMVDVHSVGKKRMEATGLISSGDIPSAGEVRLAFPEPAPQDVIAGEMPPAFRALPEAVSQMLDWKALKKIYTGEQKKSVLHVVCGNCAARLRVDAKLLGRQRKCPGCKEVITIVSNADLSRRKIS